MSNSLNNSNYDDAFFQSPATSQFPLPSNNHLTLNGPTTMAPLPSTLFSQQSKPNVQTQLSHTEESYIKAEITIATSDEYPTSGGYATSAGHATPGGHPAPGGYPTPSGYTTPGRLFSKSCIQLS
ncbi:hypothetical protein F5Y13DRAFT_185370 [Hypoxylon sp. FL1857]|nr:hypothetical protein F5Y13DRAFT_185370 [Hypoxylon sp. FL1857]